MSQQNQKNIGFLSDTQSKSSEVEQNYALFLHEGLTKNQVSFSRLPNITRYLKYLNNSAGSLYMFYVSSAKNETGSSFWSIDSLAEKLDVSSKTITNSNTLLSDLGLIHRDKGTKSSVTTTLLPTESFLITNPNEQTMSILNGTLYTLCKDKALSIASPTRNNEFTNYNYYKLNKSAKYKNIDVYAITMQRDTRMPAHTNEKNIFKLENISANKQPEMDNFNLLLDTNDKLDKDTLKNKLALLRRFLDYN